VKDKIHCITEKSDFFDDTAHDTHSYKWAEMVTENWAEWNVKKYRDLSIKWTLIYRSFTIYVNK